mmetsp:Transcript_7238/g.8371  ORF Transcript_7238/g.8371 Transcript_7238/m.8371 type:complete len:143 (-) Transcript_7238:91-519(-)
MQRINEILAKSREAQAQATQTVAKSETGGRIRELSKFIKENKVPRYVLFGVIILKSVSIYDKMKQLVAINQMQAAIVALKSQDLRSHFESEEELQDMLTKRMLDFKTLNDDDDDLGDEDDPNKYQSSAMLSHGAKAKTRAFQ